MSSVSSVVDNDGLLKEILIRLPLKSILRSKSVCRHWLSLISSRYFSRLLYPDPYLVSGLLLHRTCMYDDFVSLSDNPTSRPFERLKFVIHPAGAGILQSCHGLLICADYIYKNDYCIYNPTTKQFRIVPRPGGQGSTDVCGIALAYDPHKGPHYNVVCVRDANPWQDYLGIYSELEDYLSNYSRYSIEIYSSETRSWRLSGRSFIAHDDVDFTRGVFWNGAVHWVNRFGPSLYFKVDEEKLRKMPMPVTPIPDDWDGGRRLMYFDESREHLHLVEIYGTAKFDVYEMRTDYSGWFVKYHVDLNSITLSFPEMIATQLDPSNLRYYRFLILGIIREEDDGESYMLFHIPDKVIRYNLNDRTFNMIYKFSLGHEDLDTVFWYSWLHSFHYIETLASI